jgi:hypothetical protein
MKSLRLLAPVLLASALPGSAFATPPVLIETVGAQVDRSWLYELRETRAKAGAPRESDARAIAADMARDFQATLDRTLRDQGFQVVTAPTASAVRLSASIHDIFVSAPENTTAGVTAYTRQTGRATLRVRAVDASGKVLLQAEQRSDAGDMGRLQRATDVSNRFWFEALFRDWSADIARQLKQKAP